MRTPAVAVTPDAVAVSIEDADLAVDGTSCTSVAVTVEGYRLHQVLVPMSNEVKGGTFVYAWRLTEIWCYACHFV